MNIMNYELFISICVALLAFDTMFLILGILI